VVTVAEWLGGSFESQSRFEKAQQYKRESKGRWPIQICRFIFVNCCLIWLSKH
jgi:hypothetical protein